MVWFILMWDFNVDDVIFIFGCIFNCDYLWYNVNGSSFFYFDSLQFVDSVESVCKLDNQIVEFCFKWLDVLFFWYLVIYYVLIIFVEYVVCLMQDDCQE